MMLPCRGHVCEVGAVCWAQHLADTLAGVCKGRVVVCVYVLLVG